MTPTEQLAHDQLQAKCFQWAHNTYPSVRGLIWAVMNEQKKAIGETKYSHMRRIQAAKAIGLRPGVYDLNVYWHGRLYGFDMKVGKDKLSEEQKDWAEKVELHGGKCFEIRGFEQFQTIFMQIMEL